MSDQNNGTQDGNQGFGPHGANPFELGKETPNRPSTEQAATLKKGGR